MCARGAAQMQAAAAGVRFEQTSMVRAILVCAGRRELALRWRCRRLTLASKRTAKRWSERSAAHQTFAGPQLFAAFDMVSSAASRQVRTRDALVKVRAKAGGCSPGEGSG